MTDVAVACCCAALVFCVLASAYAWISVEQIRAARLHSNVQDELLQRMNQLQNHVNKRLLELDKTRRGERG